MLKYPLLIPFIFFGFTLIAQIVTPEIEVTDISPSTTIKVNGNNKLTINENDVTINGSQYVNGDLVVEGKIWFGGGTNSSYIQHVEGAAPPNGSSSFHVYLPPGDFFNIKVSVGGRSYDPFQVEYKVFGYLIDGSWTNHQTLSVFANVGMSYTKHDNSHIEIFFNNHQASWALFAGHIVVSTHRW